MILFALFRKPVLGYVLEVLWGPEKGEVAHFSLVTNHCAGQSGESGNPAHLPATWLARQVILHTFLSHSLQGR